MGRWSNPLDACGTQDPAEQDFVEPTGAETQVARRGSHLLGCAAAGWRLPHHSAAGPGPLCATTIGIVCLPLYTRAADWPLLDRRAPAEMKHK